MNLSGIVVVVVVLLLLTLGGAAAALAIRRRRTGSSIDREAEAARFWDWWKEERDTLILWAQHGAWHHVEAAIEPRLEALHPGLTFEAEGSPSGPFELRISAEGDLDARRSLACLLQAAPDDPDWIFGVRGPSLDARVEVQGVTFEVEAAEFVAALDPKLDRIDLVVRHPRFTALPAMQRPLAARRLVLAVLGDDETSRWIGKLETEDASVRDDAARPLIELPARVSRLRSAREEAAPRSKQDENRSVAIVLHRRVKPIDFLDQEVHATVHLRGAPTTSLGVIDASALARLERDLLARLGDQAVMVAHEHLESEQCLHLYVSDRPEVRAILEAWGLGHEQRAWVELQDDPHWLWLQEQQTSTAASERPTISMLPVTATA